MHGVALPGQVQQCSRVATVDAVAGTAAKRTASGIRDGANREENDAILDAEAVEHQAGRIGKKRLSSHITL